MTNIEIKKFKNRRVEMEWCCSMSLKVVWWPSVAYGNSCGDWRQWVDGCVRYLSESLSSILVHPWA